MPKRQMKNGDMSNMAKNKASIFDDIDEQSLENAAEVLPRIQLPQPDDQPIDYQLVSEPEMVDVKSRPGETMVVIEAVTNGVKGSMIIPKSLKFNMAAALVRRNVNPKTFKFTGSVWRVWSVMEGQNKYYQTELIEQ